MNKINAEFGVPLRRRVVIPSSTILPLLLILLGGFIFVPVLRGYWLADDFSWIHDFFHYDWGNIPRLFLGDWARADAKEYRPLWALSFIVDLAFWGPDPRWLHLTNILFHMFVSALVWYLVKNTIYDNGLAALLSLTFFVLAPIHPEPVAWIAARGHVLVSIFILGAVILLKRFQMYGGIGNYLASLVAGLAAFATQEAAVALPFLLLLMEVVNNSRRSSFIHRITVHVPYWGLLGVYLGFRMLIFGSLGREGTTSTIQELLHHIYYSVRMLWLSPHTIQDAPGIFVSAGMKWLLFVLVTMFLCTPLVSLRGDQRRSYLRAFICFAIGWPLISTAVYIGSSSQRHLYLASIGPCIALGIAGACLLVAKRPFAMFGPVMLVVLGFAYGWSLLTGVTSFVLDGERSHKIKQEIDRSIALVAQDKNAIVVIIPEVANQSRVFWDYFYPIAIEPPFMDSHLSVPVISSFASCHCTPEEWISEHGASLSRIIHGTTGPIYVVEWDNQQNAFVTRTLDQDQFVKGSYLVANGPLLRPRLPGQTAVSLP